MTASVDNLDRIMRDLGNLLEMKSLEDKSTEYLMQALDAIREGRYPTKNHGNLIVGIIQKRIPLGFLIVWNAKQLWRQK